MKCHTLDYLRKLQMESLHLKTWKNLTNRKFATCYGRSQKMMYVNNPHFSDKLSDAAIEKQDDFTSQDIVSLLDKTEGMFLSLLAF